MDPLTHPNLLRNKLRQEMRLSLAFLAVLAFMVVKGLGIYAVARLLRTPHAEALERAVLEQRTVELEPDDEGDVVVTVVGRSAAEDGEDVVDLWREFPRPRRAHRADATD